MSIFLVTNTTFPVTGSAYDASGSLVGQQRVSEVINDFKVSIFSSGNPIATVEIQWPGGGYFVVDTITFNSSIAMAKFAATACLAPKLSAFAATETLTLEANSPALNRTTQAVTLSIGVLSVNFPAGSFVKDDVPRTNAYVYRGKVNEVDLFVWLSPTGAPQSYWLIELGGGYTVTSRH